jgi:hypothetical protein
MNVGAVDVVFACSANYTFDQVRPWVSSIRRSGFSGEIAMLVYTGTAEMLAELEQAGVKVLTVTRNSRGDAAYNYRRDRPKDFVLAGRSYLPRRWYWQWWPPHLNESINDLRLYHAGLMLPQAYPNARYLIYSDVRDVIFQRNPVEYLEEHLTGGIDYVVAEEPHITSDQWWAKRNTIRSYDARLYERVASRPAICSGVICGRFAAMTELLLALYLQDLLRRIGDQASLNMLLTFKPWRDRTLILPWTAPFVIHAASLNKEGRPSLPWPGDAAATIRDGVVCAPDGEPYYVVHQYDRRPEWGSQLLARLA